MDRDALAHRNQQLAAAFHQAPVQHRLRRYLIRAFARFPFSPVPGNPQRILLIRPDHIGDMLLAIPAIRALKSSRPRMEIHVLAGPWAAGVLTHVQDVDVVLTIEFPGFHRGEDKQSLTAPYQQLIRVSRQLRQIGYGAAIVLRPDHWWGAMLAHAAGIRQRIGYDLPDVVSFLTHAVPHQHEHVIRQNLRLVERWTGPIADEDVPYHYDVLHEDSRYVSEYLTDFGLAAQHRLLCIHPGSGAWAKQWENSRWAQVADVLHEQLDLTILYTGTSSEHSLIKSIQNRMRHKAFNVAGDFSLSQLAALYKRSAAVIGVDSGPLHLAAAVHTPTVTLFGPADPVEFAPWGDRNQHVVLASTIACQPCRVLDWGDDDPENHPCMRDIPVAAVLEATRRVIQAP